MFAMLKKAQSPPQQKFPTLLLNCLHLSASLCNMRPKSHLADSVTRPQIKLVKHEIKITSVNGHKVAETVKMLTYERYICYRSINNHSEALAPD